MTPDLARFLARLLPACYLREPYQVLLEDPGAGLLGHVSWADGRWTIRLSPRLRGRGLLRVALHEVGHVVLGHVAPGEGGRVHQGRPLDPAEQAYIRALQRQWEEEANEWADRELPGWLVGLGRYL
jgi:hypothetical protein